MTTMMMMKINDAGATDRDPPPRRRLKSRASAGVVATLCLLSPLATAHRWLLSGCYKMNPTANGTAHSATPLPKVTFVDSRQLS